MLSALKNARAQKARMADIRLQMTELRRELDSAYSNFNSVSDPQLLEAIVFEISALQSRYSCMLREIKTLSEKDGKQIC